MSRLLRPVVSALVAAVFAPSPALAQTDPFIEFQWHLKSRAAEPAGANARAVWPTTKGEGIVVGISDSGLDYTHPDLAPNYVPSLSFDFVSSDPDPFPVCLIPCPSERHATAVAGITAARGDNGIGVSGVAPHAGIAGLRLITGVPISDATHAGAMAHQLQAIQVVNLSWGPALAFAPLRPLIELAMTQAITQGRGGKGRIYVKAAGNDGNEGDNCNFDGLANSRYVITVGALGDSGQQASYSESCSALFASAAGGDFVGRRMVTTDLIGISGYDQVFEYTDAVLGTSFAAPVVSGVVALMLARNPALTWRDVKEILVRSAVRINSGDPGWSGGPFPHNEKYGFGLVDAQAAVTLASSWTNIAAESAIPEVQRVFSQPAVIPDSPAAGLFDTITIGNQFSDFRVEHVEVVFDADHPFRRDIEVTLTSPSGVVSHLATARFELEASFDGFRDWRFGSVRHWGEPAAGTWTLRVADRFAVGVGTWNSWSLRIYGTSTASPPGMVTILTNGSGTITSSTGLNCGGGGACSQSVQAGTNMTLTATPSPGFVFTGWSGAGCVGVLTCTILVTGDVTVTATFVAETTGGGLVFAAVLPSSRSTQVGTPATVFAAIINFGPGTATSCRPSPMTSIPATFSFQTTNPFTNALTGTPNTPADVPSGFLQTYVLAFTPTAPFPPTDVQISFDCANTAAAAVIVGLNTVLLSASATPIPDIVALGATHNNDGIVTVPGVTGTGAFAVATVNVGAAGSITASVDTGGVPVPLSVSLCQTSPATGACVSSIGPSVTTTILGGQTPTFGVFVSGVGAPVAFSPGVNRIYVRFRDDSGVTRGSTSVAVQIR